MLSEKQLNSFIETARGFSFTRWLKSNNKEKRDYLKKHPNSLFNINNINTDKTPAKIIKTYKDDSDKTAILYDTGFVYILDKNGKVIKKDDYQNKEVGLVDYLMSLEGFE